MGKNSQRISWPGAKKLCRLNQLDIEMARRLGFKPGGLIRAIPDPKQKWKYPVKSQIRDLYQERFGVILGEKPVDLTPAEVVSEEEAARIFGEQLYWENYWERNEE